MSTRKQEIEIDQIVDLLKHQTGATRDLFAQALNIYVSPTTAGKTEKEKLDLLRKAIEKSVTGGDLP